MTYELVSLVGGVLGGALAGAIFSRIWAVSDEAQAPEPTALDRSVGEVLVASALQDAVFGVLKAVFGRITAKGCQRFTGINQSAELQFRNSQMVARRSYPAAPPS